MQYRKKKELIEQNDGHLWIQHPQITQKKLLYTMHQIDIFFFSRPAQYIMASYSDIVFALELSLKNLELFVR